MRFKSPNLYTKFPQPIAVDNELQPTLLAGSLSIFMYVAPARLFKQQVTLMKSA
jgi:hypothetical protein